MSPDINGKIKSVLSWPKILHIVVDQPSCLTEEEKQQGVMIRGVCYEFTGLIHDRGDGEWDVSVKRQRGTARKWYRLKKDSKEEHSGTSSLLSGITLIQLCAKQADETESVEVAPLETRDAECNVFSVQLVPHLRNGDLKICHINASFVLALRAYPDLRTLVANAKQQETASGLQSLVSQIEAVMESTQETNLLGLKGVMKEMHPGEHAYDEGYAQEVLHQLLEDMIKAFTGDSRFRHVRVETADKGNPPRCCKCRELLAPFSESKLRNLTILRFRPTQTGTVTFQQMIDKYEKEKRNCDVWTGCLKCGEQQKARAVSELKTMPKQFLMESTNGATNRVGGFEEDASWGVSTYKVTAVLHHNPVEEHFWASVFDGHVWWRIDDSCGDPNISRKKYVKRRGVLETTGDVIQRLDQHVLFVLFERNPEEEAMQVFLFFKFGLILLFRIVLNWHSQCF